MTEGSKTWNCQSSDGVGWLYMFPDRQIDGILHDSSSAQRQPIRDLLYVFSPAIAILIVTLCVSFFLGTVEGLFLVQWNVRTFGRFLAITLILLAPLLVLPQFLAFFGKRFAAGGSFELVRGEIRKNVEFPKSLLWIVRPLQGIGISMLFSNEFLNLFRNFPEVSFLDALIRPVLFVVISVPISILLSVIWSLDDLGVKLYLRPTGEVRLIGSYVGTLLPVISGALGIYSLFQRSSPVNALLFLSLMLLVLYPPYVLFAAVHHMFLNQRRTILSQKLKLSRVEVQLSEGAVGRENRTPR